MAPPRDRDSGNGINLRTVLLALPAVYLLIALVGMNGRSPHLPNFSVVPQRVIFLNNPAPAARAASAIGAAEAAAQMRVTEVEAPAPEPVVVAPVAAPVADSTPPPPKPADTETMKVKYYDGNSVSVYPHRDQGQAGANWWPSVEHGWEKDSLQAIHTLLLKTPGATYVDFGSWIGPTVLFAAPYANRVIGLEPDFSAFSELYWNVQANAHLSKKVTVKSLCIAGKPGTLTMYGQPGSSMSAISTVEETEKQKKVKGRTEWTIECTTLDVFIEREGIDPSKLVLKIDTEGAEKEILIQLKPWIAKHKPSMLLSMHAFAYPKDEAAHHELQEIIMSYKTVRFPNGKIVNREQFSVGGWCRLCALLLTDISLEEADVK